MNTPLKTRVDFDAVTRRVEGAFAVYPNALLFESGDYADKNFSMNDAEMDAAISGFKPVFGAIEHTPFLRGRALTVRSIRRDAANPRLLRGEVAVPLGLDELIDDAERSLSAEWDRDTKRLVGAALTLNPRIKGASLVAKFATFAADHADDPTAMRDAADALAAFCACQAEAMTTTPTPSPTEERTMNLDEKRAAARQKLDEFDEAVLDALLDTEAEGDGPEYEDDDDLGLDDAAEYAPEPTAFSDDPEAIALRAEVEALKAERRHERAVSFAAEMKAQGRIAPYQEAMAVAAMFTAMDDDAMDPRVVAFSQGGKPVTGSREAMVRADYAQREARHYGPQLAGGTGGRALAQFTGEAAETPEEKRARIDASLANTSTGRAILARRHANGNARP